MPDIDDRTETMNTEEYVAAQPKTYDENGDLVHSYTPEQLKALVAEAMENAFDNGEIDADTASDMEATDISSYFEPLQGISELEIVGFVDEWLTKRKAEMAEAELSAELLQYTGELDTSAMSDDEYARFLKGFNEARDGIEPTLTDDLIYLEGRTAYDARVRRAKRRARAGLKLTDFERDVIADYRAKQED